MFNRYKKPRTGNTLPPSLISGPIQQTTAQMSFPASTPLPRTPSISKIPVRTATLRKSRRPRSNSTSPMKPGYTSKSNTHTPVGSPKKNTTKSHSRFGLWSNASRTSIFQPAGVSDEPKTASTTWGTAVPVSGGRGLLRPATASAGRFSWSSQSPVSLALSPPMSDTCSAMAAEVMALKAENETLSREIVAERKFSAMLVEVLKSFHECAGRVNPTPGDIGSAYYRELRDEFGDPLVPMEYVTEGLAANGVDSEWEDETEVLGDSGS